MRRVGVSPFSLRISRFSKTNYYYKNDTPAEVRMPRCSPVFSNTPPQFEEVKKVESIQMSISPSVFSV